MTAFVTGATGLLGSNLVAALVRDGHAVRALARSSDKADAQLGHLPGVETVVGDLDDVAAFAPALDGCSVVFHTAAYFREYYAGGVSEAAHRQRLHRLNVRASVDLAEAAHAAGVGAFVNTSSSGTVGSGEGGAGGTEDDPPPLSARTNAYFASKLDGERALNAVAARTGLRVVHVLPGLMIGPGDAAPTTMGQFVLNALARKVPVALPGGSTFADPRDVADAMLAAASRGPSGERYAVAGRFHSVADVLAGIARVSGVAQPTRVAPLPVALAAAWAGERLAPVTGRPAPVTVSGVRAVAAAHRVDSSRAERVLGASFRPLDETLGDTVAWFRTHRRAAPATAPA